MRHRNSKSILLNGFIARSDAFRMTVEQSNIDTFVTCFLCPKNSMGRRPLEGTTTPHDTFSATTYMVQIMRNQLLDVIRRRDASHTFVHCFAPVVPTSLIIVYADKYFLMEVLTRICLYRRFPGANINKRNFGPKDQTILRTYFASFTKLWWGRIIYKVLWAIIVECRIMMRVEFSREMRVWYANHIGIRIVCVCVCVNVEYSCGCVSTYSCGQSKATLFGICSQMNIWYLGDSELFGYVDDECFERLECDLI